MQNGPGIVSPEVWWVQIKRRRGGTGYVRTRFEKQFQIFAEIGLETEPSTSTKPAFIQPKTTASATKNAFKANAPF
jgi:hypothetical protein